MFSDALNVLLNVHPQAQQCTWDGQTFRALVGDYINPTGDESRGLTDEEHDLMLTCLASDFSTYPSPGDSITISGSDYPVAFANAVPGGVELRIVCRQPATA